MKKAKIMLAAIAVTAVVSGVFAFKAKNFTNPNTFYKYGTSAGLTGCEVPTSLLYQTTAVPGETSVSIAYSVSKFQTTTPSNCSAVVYTIQ